jgi:hypothetical protein
MVAPRFARGLFFLRPARWKAPVSSYAPTRAGSAPAAGMSSRRGRRDSSESDRRALRVGERTVHAACAVLAAGAASDKLARMLGYRSRSPQSEATTPMSARRERRSQPPDQRHGRRVCDLAMGEHVRVLTGVELARHNDPRTRRRCGSCSRTRPVPCPSTALAGQGLVLKPPLARRTDCRPRRRPAAVDRVSSPSPRPHRLSTGPVSAASWLTSAPRAIVTCRRAVLAPARSVDRHVSYPGRFPSRHSEQGRRVHESLFACTSATREPLGNTITSAVMPILESWSLMPVPPTCPP